jgi:AraC family transcriptional regulator
LLPPPDLSLFLHQIIDRKQQPVLHFLATFTEVAMNRVATIFESPSLIIERIDHPAHCAHSDHQAETSKNVAVAFVERGRFSLRQEKALWTFQPGDVLISSPGLHRRYHHFEECPDDVCLSLAFAPETVEDALGKLRRPSHAPRIAHVPATFFAHRMIESALRSNDKLWIEELAFHSLLALAPGAWDRPRDPSVSTAHTRRIRSAIELMAASLAEPCSLTSIARQVGMSPFHFCRTFSGLVGLSPHQYLLRLRLRRSAKMLRRGASVTDAALSNGFENLSHFTRSFQRRFAVKPSEYPQS